MTEKQGHLAGLPAARAADKLHSAAIHLLRRVHREDSASGQGPARLSALSVLVFAGPQTLGSLAEAERVRPATMSRIVAGLERSGLVRRSTDPRDRRSIRLQPTPKGTRLLQRARQRRIAALAELFAALPENELDLLLRAADLIEQSVRKDR